MRQAATMVHPVVILVGTLVAVVVLYPFSVVDAADIAAATPVEAETFDVRPTGTSVVTDTTFYSISIEGQGRLARVSGPRGWNC